MLEKKPNRDIDIDIDSIDISDYDDTGLSMDDLLIWLESIL